MVIDIFKREKKYDIIYCDPPWNYGSRGPRNGKFGKLPYNKMKTKDVARLPIKHIKKENSALFLWATSAFIEDAIFILNCWNFNFIRIDSVWKKEFQSGKTHATCGPWGMTDAEFLLMGVSGKMCSKQTLTKKNLLTVVPEIKEEHSKKPEIFRLRIEERFQDMDRLELFAREQNKGWDCWGDEV